MYHLRPANGQPRVLYQLNNDARLDYRLTSAGIELAGGNRKRLVYTSRSKDVARSGGGEGSVLQG